MIIFNLTINSDFRVVALLLIFNYAYSGKKNAKSSPRGDLNSRPFAYEANAITTMLRGR